MALAIPGYLWVQSLPRRVRICTLPAPIRPCPPYPSSLISWRQSGPSGAALTRAASWGLIQVGGEAGSTFRRGWLVVVGIGFLRIMRGGTAMKLPQTGGCQCGKIRYEITVAPTLVYTFPFTHCPRLPSHPVSLA